MTEMPIVPSRSEVAPLVSIIMVTYNKPVYTRIALNSILTQTGYPNYHIIIVDNHSDDETRAMLSTYEQHFEHISIVWNDENKGFAAANNQGIQVAQERNSTFVVLINNDVVVTDGWLTTLLDHLQDPTVGLVGPVTNYTSNEARIPTSYRSLDDLPAFAARYTRHHAGQTQEVQMFPLFCAAIRCDTIDAVGGLDEQFGYGMFEDDDYAEQLHQHGLRILCAHDAFVHHFGRVSFSQLDDERFTRIFEQNRALFEQKWGKQWVPYRPKRRGLFA